MQVDGDRLRADIEANAAFGAVEAPDGRGRTVLTGTEADRAARDRFVARLEDAGLDVRVDPVGNIAGRWTPPHADPDAAPVAVGSHLDSVVRGGIFDGPLGTYGALEAVRAIQESPREPHRPVDVVAFTEEEGARFGIGTLGSSVATGVRDHGTVESLTDDEGVTVAAALEGIGYRGDADLGAADWDAWAELHVEQGTRLEATDTPVGIVTDIVGITNCLASVSGAADHAGATMMAERTDALCAAAEFVLDVERAARDAADRGGTAVGTVGEFTVEPNYRAIVPGEVEMRLDIRDVEYAAMNDIVDRARDTLARLERDRGVETALDRYRDQRPSAMADRCIEAARRTADEAGLAARTMHSAAMHDTANVAGVTDAVMLFAPSRDGISHTPQEWTDWAACRRATQVLAGTVATLAE